MTQQTSVTSEYNLQRKTHQSYLKTTTTIRENDIKSLYKRKV